MKAKPTSATILLLLLNFNMYCQPFSNLTSDNCLDVAGNNVSDGVIVRFGSVTTLKIRNYHAQAGVMWSGAQQKDLTFSGWFVNASGNFRIKKTFIEVAVLYHTNLFSPCFRETNLGMTAGYKGRHFSATLGNNYRTYKFTKKGFSEKGLNESAGSSISEPRNLMYSFTYFIMPVSHQWNAALSITNFDDFLIQQETNPMVALKIPVQINPRLSIYAELWYQSAGLLNLQVNDFGYHVKTGIVWKLK